MAAVKSDPQKTEPNAGLDQLAGIAAQADSAVALVENPVAADAAQDPAAPDYATEASALVDMVAAMICGYEPKCLPLWGDDRKAGISAALAPVMEKYNFTLGAIPPEITLLIMVGPPLYQSARIIADGMNKQQAKPQDPSAPVAAPEPGANAVATETHSPEMMSLA